MISISTTRSENSPQQKNKEAVMSSSVQEMLAGLLACLSDQTLDYEFSVLSGNHHHYEWARGVQLDNGFVKIVLDFLATDDFATLEITSNSSLYWNTMPFSSVVNTVRKELDVLSFCRDESRFWLFDFEL